MKLEIPSTQIRRRFFFVILMLSIVCIYSGCGPENEFAPPPPPTVDVANPTVKTVTIYTDFTGQLAAEASVDIRARVKGFLESVNFASGKRVKKGDLLFTIEKEQYEAAVKAAEGVLGKAEANLKIAKAMAKRKRELYASHAISEIEYIEAQAQEDAAQSSVEQAEAKLADAKLNLSYTKIYAPIEGRISRNLVDAGNLVGAGEMTKLASIVNDRPIYAYFKVNERYILKRTSELMNADPSKNTGDAVADLKLDVVLALADGTQYPDSGTVDYISNKVNPQTGLIEMRAVFPNPKTALLPGLFARIRFPQKIENAILVPDSAIQRDLGGFFVLVVDQDNVVEQRYIQTGDIIENRNRIVKEGLKPDERIVITGLQRARPGSPVNAEMEGK